MNKRVLFIDDQLELWENLLKEELEPYGFELKGEEDPAKALKTIASYHPDVVLLDILFPTGYEGKPTLERIKKRYPNLPIMMITSTMDKVEYKPEDYALADYSFSKVAISEGDYADLAKQLHRVIEKAEARKAGEQDKTGYLRYGFIVGSTKVMKDLVVKVEKIADEDHTVLITGESGTGKELLAQAIHKLSLRRDKPFVAVNCGAIPSDLVESELFGHMKGSFTDAHRDKVGNFEAANMGTLFLDEIGDLSPAAQVKILRALQAKQITRIGATSPISLDIRIIAATNQDLRSLISQGRFREDLFSRLNVVSLHLPALRERKGDIPVFFEHFVRKANENSQKRILPILRSDLREKLTSHSWPGNVRDLEHKILEAIALADGNILQVSNFGDLAEKEKTLPAPLSDLGSIVDRIYRKEIGWKDLKKRFGAGGEERRAVLMAVIDRWNEIYGQAITQRELAALLGETRGNVGRILPECEIWLRKLKKERSAIR